LVMVVFGGLGSYTGSVLSATILSYLTIKLTKLAAWRLVIYSFVLILVMIFYPKGLFGIKEFSMTNAILVGPGKVKYFFTVVIPKLFKGKNKNIKEEKYVEEEVQVNNNLEATENENIEEDKIKIDGGKTDGE
ncbi:MAG: hypothetical protein J6W64_00850, partial [Bacilli bacterium]|nr:hypothetical protein [Bacilli bacterium]